MRMSPWNEHQNPSNWTFVHGWAVRTSSQHRPQETPRSLLLGTKDKDAHGEGAVRDFTCDGGGEHPEHRASAVRTTGPESITASTGFKVLDQESVNCQREMKEALHHQQGCWEPFPCCEPTSCPLYTQKSPSVLSTSPQDRLFMDLSVLIG